MEFRELTTRKAEICEPILRALPDWFGIEAAIVQYLADLESTRTWIAEVDDRPAGFLAVTFHNPYTAEVHVMGVLPKLHRTGCGRQLLDAVENELRSFGYEYLAVKTLAPSHPDVHYARTRAFYTAMEFRPVEEFPTLWGPENPCLLMIKRL